VQDASSRFNVKLRRPIEVGLKWLCTVTEHLAFGLYAGRSQV
jgi:hypothetical protein